MKMEDRTASVTFNKKISTGSAPAKKKHKPLAKEDAYDILKKLKAKMLNSQE